jgi:hypothetical protein
MESYQFLLYRFQKQNDDDEEELLNNISDFLEQVWKVEVRKKLHKSPAWTWDEEKKIFVNINENPSPETIKKTLLASLPCNT